MLQQEKRETVFKLLFLAEFHPEEEWPGQADLFLDQIEGLEEDERKQILEKWRACLAKREVIDKELNLASEGWKTSRMSKADLCVLRLCTYEMDDCEDIPIGVAISEAVRIAKLYGGESSGLFVNGILGKMAADRGEPKKSRKGQGGKPQGTAPKKNKSNVSSKGKDASTSAEQGEEAQ